MVDSMIDFFSICCDGDGRYWMKLPEHNYWDRITARNLIDLFKLNAQFIIPRVEVLWPADALKARLFCEASQEVEQTALLTQSDFGGGAILIADFPDSQLSDEQLPELKLGHQSGKEISKMIVENGWEEAIPQIAHTLAILNIVDCGGEYQQLFPFYRESTWNTGPPGKKRGRRQP
jgi:hypothetical protein